VTVVPVVPLVLGLVALVAAGVLTAVPAVIATGTETSSALRTE
jgi:hypothetical protein